MRCFKTESNWKMEASTELIIKYEIWLYKYEMCHLVRHAITLVLTFKLRKRFVAF